MQQSLKVISYLMPISFMTASNGIDRWTAYPPQGLAFDQVKAVFEPRVKDLEPGSQSQFFKDVLNNLNWYQDKGAPAIVKSISSKEQTPIDSKQFCSASTLRRVYWDSSERVLKQGIPLSCELKLIFFQVGCHSIAVALPGDREVDLSVLKKWITVQWGIHHPDLKFPEAKKGTNNPASFFLENPRGMMVIDNLLWESDSDRLWTNLGTKVTCSSVEFDRIQLLAALAVLPSVRFVDHLSKHLDNA